MDHKFQDLIFSAFGFEFEVNSNDEMNYNVILDSVRIKTNLVKPDFESDIDKETLKQLMSETKYEMNSVLTTKHEQLELSIFSDLLGVNYHELLHCIKKRALHEIYDEVSQISFDEMEVYNHLRRNEDDYYEVFEAIDELIQSEYFKDINDFIQFYGSDSILNLFSDDGIKKILSKFSSEKVYAEEFGIEYSAFNEQNANGLEKNQLEIALINALFKKVYPKPPKNFDKQAANIKLSKFNEAVTNWHITSRQLGSFYRVIFPLYLWLEDLTLNTQPERIKDFNSYYEQMVDTTLALVDYLKGMGENYNPSNDLLMYEEKTNALLLLEVCLNNYNLNGCNVIEASDMKALAFLTLFNDIDLKRMLIQALFNEKGKEVFDAGWTNGLSYYFLIFFGYVPFLKQFIKAELLNRVNEDVYQGILDSKPFSLREKELLVGLYNKAFIYSALKSREKYSDEGSSRMDMEEEEDGKIPSCYDISSFQSMVLQFQDTELRDSTVAFFKELYSKVYSVKIEWKNKMPPELIMNSFQKYCRTNRESLMDDAVEVITGFYFGIADKFREGMGINSSTPPEKEETQGLNDVIKVFKTYFKSIDNEEKIEKDFHKFFATVKPLLHKFIGNIRE